MRQVSWCQLWDYDEQIVTIDHARKIGIDTHQVLKAKFAHIVESPRIWELTLNNRGHPVIPPIIDRGEGFCRALLSVFSVRSMNTLGTQNADGKSVLAIYVGLLGDVVAEIEMMKGIESFKQVPFAKLYDYLFCSLRGSD
jgi:hypothetical protein